MLHGLQVPFQEMAGHYQFRRRCINMDSGGTGIYLLPAGNVEVEEVKMSNRVLIIFGSAIAFLIIITVVLVFAFGQKNVTLYPENTPEGTVQHYLLEIQEKDYISAYSRLIPPSSTPDNPKPVWSYDNFFFSAQHVSDLSWKVTLGKVISSNQNNASVEILVDIFRSGGIFENPVHTNSITFFLRKVDGVWKISSPSDLYWLY